MNKTRKGSIVYQVRNRFGQMKSFGESKYSNKEANKKASDKYFSSRDKIFSYNTYHAYLRKGVLFAKWAKEYRSCRTLEEAQQYEYLDDAQVKDLSA